MRGAKSSHSDAKLTDGKKNFHAKSSSASVHPTAIIDPQVVLGDNVVIGPYVFITGPVIVGAGTKIYSHTSIGSPAQDLTVNDSLGSLEIGRNCIIREFVSIHTSKKSDGKTLIGNNCYLMTYSHIAHDVVLEDDVVLTNGTALGGHTYIEKKAILMANAATHQFCRIGQSTVLAPYSGIRQDLPPFCLFDGRPAKFAGLNLVGLKRSGFKKDDIDALKRVTALFYKEKLPLADIKHQAQNDSTWGKNEHVQSFLLFIEESNRGISRKTIREHANQSFSHS